MVEYVGLIISLSLVPLGRSFMELCQNPFELLHHLP